METVNATTTATPKTTMTFEQYVDWKFTDWCEEKIINPTTKLEIEINSIIDFNHRLNCMLEFNRMFKRNKKFGRNVTLISKSNNVTMFPMNENQVYNADKTTNEQHIQLKTLFNLRAKKIIS